MHRSAAHARALVAAARDSSSDQRLWPRPRPIRARPQAARPPREGQEKCIHRSADRTDRSGVPWAAAWLQRLGSTGSPQRSLPRLLTSISDNQLTPWKTHLIPGSNGISRSASFTILSDRIHQQNRVFIDAGNREDYLWSRQVNTGYEQYRGTQTPADQLALDQAPRPSIHTNTFNSLPRAVTPLCDPGRLQIFLFETFHRHA